MRRGMGVGGMKASQGMLIIFTELVLVYLAQDETIRKSTYIQICMQINTQKRARRRRFNACKGKSANIHKKHCGRFCWERGNIQQPLVLDNTSSRSTCQIPHNESDIGHIEDSIDSVDEPALMFRLHLKFSSFYLCMTPFLTNVIIGLISEIYQKSYHQMCSYVSLNKATTFIIWRFVLWQKNNLLIYWMTLT